MRIVAADSASAILDEHLRPQTIVAVASVATEAPYRNSSAQISDLLMASANRHDLVVTELRMCRKLLQSVAADAVHIDMTLGAISLSKLTFSDIREMSVSSRARQNIQEVLPELRKLATQIEQTHKVEVLAVGKESLPVRIAELTAAAYSVIYASAEALKHQNTILLGLPALCTMTIGQGQVTTRSLQPGEHDVTGFAVDNDGVTEKIRASEFNNPTVRGFRILKIEKKGILKSLE